MTTEQRVRLDQLNSRIKIKNNTSRPSHSNRAGNGNIVSKKVGKRKGMSSEKIKARILEQFNFIDDDHNLDCAAAEKIVNSVISPTNPA